jgi:CDP-paratose 2-epimerase
MKVFITGGAGFIGCNSARRYLEKGAQVVIYDSLTRNGGRANLEWLSQFGKAEVIKDDIANVPAMKAAVAKHADMDICLHLAAQVAVTTSVEDPASDFSANAAGTFSLLEAVRAAKADPVLIYASTNKVYGGMEDLTIEETNGRYQYKDLTGGVGEERPLDFHSPYGCSKGAADQYVRDYHRIYKLRTVALRQSCIYGYRQFGIEDQGWVAWFTIATVLGRPITIYGDGKQVRDVLFVEDLVDAYVKVAENIDTTVGKIYNIGGGPSNTMSLHELVTMLGELTGTPPSPAYDDWRPGDQPVFVCDISKAEKEFGWKPKVGPKEGVKRLHAWVLENRGLFEKK